MENPFKMDDLGGKPTIFGNIHMRIARLSGSFSKNQATLRDAMLLHDQLRTIEIPYDVAHDLRPRPQRVGWGGGGTTNGFFGG